MRKALWGTLGILVMLLIGAPAFAAKYGWSPAQKVKSEKPGKYQRAVTTEAGKNVAWVHAVTKKGDVFAVKVSKSKGQEKRTKLSGVAHQYEALKIHDRGDPTGYTSGYTVFAPEEIDGGRSSMTRRGNVRSAVANEEGGDMKISVFKPSGGKFKTDSRTRELRQITDPTR